MQHNAERHASPDKTGQYNGLITEAFGQSNSELCDFFCKSLCAPDPAPGETNQDAIVLALAPD